MPEIFKHELWVKNITDTAKVVRNANPKKNKSLERVRTVTISDGDIEIIVKNTPEALTDFVLGEISVIFSTPQTKIGDFSNGEDKDTEKEDLEGADEGEEPGISQTEARSIATQNGEILNELEAKEEKKSWPDYMPAAEEERDEEEGEGLEGLDK